MKTKRYKVIDDKVFAYTRHGVLVELRKGDVVLKIKDSFNDKLKLRHMFRVENTGDEIDIEPMKMICFKEVE